MRRPHFGASILVISVLTGVGILLQDLRPYIPPSGPNALVDEPGDYLRQGAYERIDWLPMKPEVFSEARRLDKPILLVIGTPWSRIGRVADSGAFSDTDIQALLKRAFLCVRVDASQMPEWLNAYLPYSRARMGVVPDFQMWFLDPQGRPYDAVLIQSPLETLDPANLLSRLIAARDNLRRIRALDPSFPPAGSLQQADVNLLASLNGSPMPAFHEHAAKLVASMASQFGGFPTWAERNGATPYQQLYPASLRYLLLTGHDGDFRRATDRAIRSPIVDWLDGGFYIRSMSIDWMKPEYDKTAVQNAELMQVFAMAAVAMHDKSYETIAKATFDCLAGPFMQDGLIMGCREGDENRSGRSEHSAFPPRILRGALAGKTLSFGAGQSANAYAWAQDNLGFKVETNPAMLVEMPDPALLDRQPAALAEVLQTLRDSAADRPCNYSGPGLAEVNGIAAARMAWVARLWDDPKRLQVARDLFDRLDRFRVGDDILHSLKASRPGSFYLGDYLAYADAALQDYLATGRERSLDAGARVLKRARALFHSDIRGQWNVASGTSIDAPYVNGPEIVDNGRESCVARLIRVANDYGRLTRGNADNYETEERGEGPEFNTYAVDAVNRFAPLTSGADRLLDKVDPVSACMGPQVSGYFAAALGLYDSAHAFVVGPDCLARADELFRMVPQRLVSCCFGRVRPDLQRREPGVYVVRGARTDGPMSVVQAAAILRKPMRGF